MSAPDVKPRRYQVVAPMVVAESRTADGVRLQNFYRNAFLPPEVSPRRLELFLRRRLVVEVDDKNVPVQAATPAAAPAPAAKPARGGAAAKTTGG